MGLAFLNKKGWHTGSFQNIEKVWIAEMKDQEEKRLTQEAQRRLKEEQHYEDLKRLQVEAGLIPKSHLQRLDWMYEGGAIKNTSSEEYLLGKPYSEPETVKGEWRPTLCKESTANQANEVFTKVHEDPYFAILQEEQRRRKEVTSNPQRMNELKKEIEKMKKGKNHKKDKKDEHKHKKDKHKHKHHSKQRGDKHRVDESTEEYNRKKEREREKNRYQRETSCDSQYLPNWDNKSR